MFKKFNLLGWTALQVPEGLGLWVAFLWCGDGVMGLTVIRPWNVSGPLASVGLARLWEDSRTKGTQSHSSGVTGQAWWLLAIWQCSLVFAWEWIPGFLGAGKRSAPGRTLLLAQ